jgi:arylsulfatase A-like enzyme
LDVNAAARTGKITHLIRQPINPNVIVFVADDAGYVDFGFQGSTCRSPHIDSIAANGVRFSNAYVTAGMSHCAL